MFARHAKSQSRAWALPNWADPLSPLSGSSPRSLFLPAEIKHFARASPQSSCSNMVKFCLKPCLPAYFSGIHWRPHMQHPPPTHSFAVTPTRHPPPPSWVGGRRGVDRDMYLDDIPISTLRDVHCEQNNSSRAHVRHGCVCEKCSLRFEEEGVKMQKWKKSKSPLWTWLCIFKHKTELRTIHLNFFISLLNKQSHYPCTTKHFGAEVKQRICRRKT